MSICAKCGKEHTTGKNVKLYTADNESSSRVGNVSTSYYKNFRQGYFFICSNCRSLKFIISIVVSSGISLGFLPTIDLKSAGTIGVITFFVITFILPYIIVISIFNSNHNKKLKGKALRDLRGNVAFLESEYKMLIKIH